MYVGSFLFAPDHWVLPLDVSVALGTGAAAWMNH